MLLEETSLKRFLWQNFSKFISYELLEILVRKLNSYIFYKKR